MSEHKLNGMKGMGSEAWMANAACRDTDPDLFFPNGTTGLAADQIENAKAICRGCIAQLACLEYALNTREENGIWGGTTEEERRKILRSRRSADTA